MGAKISSSELQSMSKEDVALLVSRFGEKYAGYAKIILDENISGDMLICDEAVFLAIIHEHVDSPTHIQRFLTSWRSCCRGAIGREEVLPRPVESVSSCETFVDDLSTDYSIAIEAHSTNPTIPNNTPHSEQKIQPKSPSVVPATSQDYNEGGALEQSNASPQTSSISKTSTQPAVESVSKSDYLLMFAEIPSILEIVKKSFEESTFLSISRLVDFLTESMINIGDATVNNFKGVCDARNSIAKILETIMHDVSQCDDPGKEELLTAISRLNIITNVIHHLKWEFLVDIILDHKDTAALCDEFFGGGADAREVEKKFRKTSVYFHPDKAVGLPPTLAAKLTSAFHRLSALKEKYLNGFGEDQMPSMSTEEIVEKTKYEANYFYNKALDCNALLREKEGIAEERHFKRLRDRRDELDAMMNLNVDQVKSEKDRYAKAASDRYRAIVRTVDVAARYSRDSRKHYILAQLRFRKEAAVCFQLAGLTFEAEMYLVGALHIATHWLLDFPDLDLKTEMQDLQNTLKVCRRKDSKRKAEQESVDASDQTDSAQSEDSNTWEVALRGNTGTGRQVSLRDQQRKYRAAMVSSSPRIRQLVVHAEEDHVGYEISKEIITSSRTEEVTLYAGAGAAVVGAGAAVVASPLGTIAAAAVASGQSLGAVALGCLAAGPVAVALGAISLGGCLFFSGYLLRSGWSLSRQPQIKRALNDLIQNAVQEFQQGNLDGFFRELGKSFGAEKPLLEYDPPRKIEARPGDIVTQLREYGLRADGIAFILNLIAEGLVGGLLKMDMPYGRDALRLEGMKFMYEIESNKDLEEDVKKLDEEMRMIKSESINKRLSSFFKWKSSIFSTIPESYFTEATVAPFWSRLEEMKNVARINQSILYLLSTSLDEEESIQSAIDRARAAQKSMTDNFQYFSVGNGQARLNALCDLLAAFDVELPDESAKEFVTSESNMLEFPTDPTMVTAVDWGGLQMRPHNMKILDAGDCVIDIFNSFLRRQADVDPASWESCCLTLTDIIQRTREDLDRKAKQWVDAGEGDMIEITVPHHEADAEQYEFLVRCKEVEQVLLARKTTVQSLLKKRFHPVLGQIFNCDIATCCIDSKSMSFVPDDVNAVPPREGILRIYMYSDEEWDDKGFPILAFLALIEALDEGYENVQVFDALKKDFQVAQQRLQKADGCKCTSIGIKYYREAQMAFQRVLEKQFGGWNVIMTFQLPVSGLYTLSEPLTASGGILSSHEFSKMEVDACLGFAECLIGMSKFKKALYVLRTVSSAASFENERRYWYLKALASRRLHNYNDAAYSIQEALKPSKIGDTFEEGHCLKERKIITVMTATRSTNSPLAIVQNKFPAQDIDYSPRSRDSPYYNIISIDGGGIRGILPAMWLAEVEKRAKRPISSMVQMLAGTSTGSIIAAALSTAKSEGGRPISAKSVAELYLDPIKLNTLFTRSWTPGGLLGAKYLGSGRQQVIKEYVGDRTMGESLTELLITAVDSTLQSETHKFSKFTTPHITVADAAMASSAAPTYFPGHEIGGITFIDGGLQANNPAEMAWNHAFSDMGHAVDNIRIWSLGTGDHVPESPFGKSTNQGGLFYATRAHELAMGAQQGNVDRNLFQQMPRGNYSRWQVWFEDMGPMDDFSEQNLKRLVDDAWQFIEENDTVINDCVEALTKSL